MTERVIYTIKAGVADVRLNRPEKMNALDPAMFKALITTEKELAAVQSNLKNRPPTFTEVK